MTRLFRSFPKSTTGNLLIHPFQRLSVLAILDNLWFFVYPL